MGPVLCPQLTGTDPGDLAQWNSGFPSFPSAQTGESGPSSGLERGVANNSSGLSHVGLCPADGDI